MIGSVGDGNSDAFLSEAHGEEDPKDSDGGLLPSDGVGGQSTVEDGADNATSATGKTSSSRQLQLIQAMIDGAGDDPPTQELKTDEKKHDTDESTRGDGDNR